LGTSPTVQSQKVALFSVFYAPTPQHKKRVKRVTYIKDSANTNTSGANRNTIEKQYRNRLNAQFASLLATVQQSLVSAGIDGVNGVDGVDGVDVPQKVSKRKVLNLA
jgi:hypothetical protein